MHPVRAQGAILKRVYREEVHTEADGGQEQ